MDGQYASSGFPLYGQPLQAPAVQQSGQQLGQNPGAQQMGGYTLIPAPTAGGQPTLTSLRNQPLQLLQQASAAAQNKPQQQGTLGSVSFQQPPGQPQQQPQQQRLHAAQLPGLTSQQLQFLQAAQPGGQLTAQSFQSYSQPLAQLGAIQILQPKTQPQQQPPQQNVVGRTFQQQPTMQPAQVLSQQTAQALQQGQGLPGPQAALQQQVPGLQTIPGVQVLQQYSGYSQQQPNTPTPLKQATVQGTTYAAAGHQSLGPAPGTASGHHTGSLFSNSNQRGSYGQTRYGWNERDRPDRPEFRGRKGDRGRRDDRGNFGSRPPFRDMASRFSRDREAFRHERGNRDRYDRGFRDYPRRDRERKPSPLHHHYEPKKEEVRKEAHRELQNKPVQLVTGQEFKTPLPMPTPLKQTPVADYIVRVPQVPFATSERDYSDIARRYTHLCISPDFTKLVCHWAKGSTEVRYPYGCSLCPLNKPVKFEMVQGPYEAEQEIVLPAASNQSPHPVRYNAKVMFVCATTFFDETGGYSKGKFDGGTHLINALKFVIVREEKDKKKTGIMCLGGPYDPDIDSGNPAEEMDGLKRACVRHVMAQTQLDLTPCTTWIRFCDVHYSRMDAKGKECEEVTVVFIVDVSEIVPTMEEWPTVWKEQTEWKKKTAQADLLHAAAMRGDGTAQENGAPQDDDSSDVKKDLAASQTQDTPMEEEKPEEIPKEVSLLMKCRTAKNGRVKTMSISLDGLLDYDENDKDEATFELSLMAESFNEMLMRDYGLLILNALMEQKSLSTEPVTDDKKRPGSQFTQEAPEPQGKKQKQTETTTETAEKTEAQHPATAEEMDVQYPDSPGDVVHVGDIEAAQPESNPAVTSEVPSAETKQATEETVAEDVVMEPTDTAAVTPVVNAELLFAFRFFDRAGCCLAPRVVRELVHGAAAMNKEKHDRVCYRSLTDKGTTLLD